jgi:hypothetical protein
MNELENYIHHYFSIGVYDCKILAAQYRQEELFKGEFYLKSNKYRNKLSFIQEGIFRIFVILPDKEVTQ